MLDRTYAKSRFIVCEGGLQTNRTRVEIGAKEASLEILGRIDVVPRAGKAVLFSVYEMAPRLPDAADADAAAKHRKRRPSFMIETSRVKRVERGVPIEVITIRDELGDRTDLYRSLMSDMGIPPRK